MIGTLSELRALYAAPGERAVRKQLAQLDVHCRRFIELSPFCVVASAGTSDCLLDASPRGGAPGFVKVPDASTLLLPDSGGNNRLDTLENLLADPRIGVIFMVPGVDETLRVNGTGRLRDEPAFVDLFAQERQRPKLVIEVCVQEAYLHCAKAFMRSELWQPRTWPARDALPTMGQMIHDQMRADAAPESQAEMLARYRAQLADERTTAP
ncbi:MULTISPECIES: pyridoxamine 5'-phosphate oxidase family protein [unclassified Variovorax]|uniref:pyridoxamine 5'-phosphate oxidase family protein n=1 Tax=unclassified Variovorax TaxID=663243 RepID=UPI001BD37DB8|nr:MULTISPECIES: pyridoxamine 5'-phosphate oxidase family protein [unclassified Variovorax]